MISFKLPNGKLNLKEIVPPIIMILVIAFVAVWPRFNSSVPNLGSRIIMYVVLAVSWNLFSGPTKYVSLATAAFFGLGIYLTALIGGEYSLFVLGLIGGAASFVLAVIVGAITLRLRGVYFTIFTFGLIELLRNLIRWLTLRYTSAIGITVPPKPLLDMYYYMLGLLVLLLVVAWLITRSRFGKALVSIGESEDAAAHIGVNTTVVKVTMFAVSAFFMGAIGALVATRWFYVDANTAFDMNYSFMPVLMVIFGGTRNLSGPIIGAAVFTYIQNTLITNPALVSYYMIAIGFIMVLAILFLPGGIIGFGYDSYVKIMAKIKPPAKEKGGTDDADT